MKKVDEFGLQTIEEALNVVGEDRKLQEEIKRKRRKRDYVPDEYCQSI
jgi:hypothetical protein